jgi:hypothetical protein
MHPRRRPRLLSRTAHAVEVSPACSRVRQRPLTPALSPRAGRGGPRRSRAGRGGTRRSRVKPGEGLAEELPITRLFEEPLQLGRSPAPGLSGAGPAPMILTNRNKPGMMRDNRERSFCMGLGCGRAVLALTPPVGRRASLTDARAVCYRRASSPRCVELFPCILPCAFPCSAAPESLQLIDSAAILVADPKFFPCGRDFAQKRHFGADPGRPPGGHSGRQPGTYAHKFPLRAAATALRPPEQRRQGALFQPRSVSDTCR